MALSNAERQRRFREKRNADPDRRTTYLESEKKRYKAEKKCGKKKLVSDMTPREHRKQKKEWKMRKQSSSATKRQNTGQVVATTPPPSIPIIHTNATLSRQKVTALKQKADENKLLNNRIAELESALKSAQTRVKTLQRQKQREKLNSVSTHTPRSKTKSALAEEHLNVSKDSSVKRTLEFHYALVDEMQVQSGDRKNAKLLSAIAAGGILRKYHLLTKFRNAVKVCGVRRRSYQQKGSLSTRLKLRVRDFFLRCDVSRICPGLKDTITRGGCKKQRRLMTDTISNLYRKFVSTEEYLSFTTFWRLKPFYVLQPKDSDRQTCLCKVCDNLQLLTGTLYREGYIPSSRPATLVELASCNVAQKLCMYGDCNECGDKIVNFLKIPCDEAISFYQWETLKENRVFKDGSEKIVTFVGKKMQTLTVIDARTLFNKQLEHYKRHFFNIKNQFDFFRKMKDNLQGDEALIHVDFAENYVCKWDAEIQSAHFGASKKQLSLHTGFFKIVGCEISSFCGVSECLDHDPFSIWAFLLPILDKIKSKHPMVTRLHFFSDGPTAQYRQKVNFYLLSQITSQKGFSFCSWNFFEAGHGKGIPDGVGATVKRAADRSVKFGNSISSSHDFIKFVSKSCSAVHLYTVDDKDIASLKEAHSIDSLKAVPKTMRLHQILCYEKDSIAFRDLSCFCNEGYECDDTHLLKHHSFPKSQIENKKNEKARKNKSARIKSGKNGGINFRKAILPMVNNCNEENNIADIDDIIKIVEKKEDKIDGFQDKMILPTVNKNGYHENKVSKTDDVIVSIIGEENHKEVSESHVVDIENEEARSAQFVKYLKELNKCKGFDELENVCKSQMAYVSQIGVQGKERNVIACKLPIESRFQRHVPNDLPIQCGQPFPIKVRCDGDCLPACGAIFAFGKDMRPAEIRVRIIHELVINANFYLDNKNLSVGLERTDKKLCAEAFASFSDHYIPNEHDLNNKAIIKALFEKEMIDICKPGSYMGIWQIFGLASVLKMRVFSAYPEVATFGSVRCDIHRLIEPRVRASDGIAKVLWTSTNNINTKSLYWRPNHFVPLLPFK